MPMDNSSPAERRKHEPAEDFAREAEEQDRGLLAELWDFLRHHAGWWLTPIVIVLLLLGAFLLLGSAAPFIYPLF